MIGAPPVKKGVGICESCRRVPATRKAVFTVRSLQETFTSPALGEETLVDEKVEKKLCEKCLAALWKAGNVSNLRFERL